MSDRLLDTNAVSAAMKADSRFSRYLQALPDETHIVTSVVVEGEILFGISRLPSGRKRTQLEVALADILTDMDGILPVTRDVAARYAKLKTAMWSRGKPMSDNDMWIAATSALHDLILVTTDVAFASVPGLTVELWSDEAEETRQMKA